MKTGERGAATRYPDAVSVDQPLQYLFSYGTLQHPDVQLDTFGRLLDSDDDALPGYTVDYAEIEDPRVVGAVDEATEGVELHVGVLQGPVAEQVLEGLVHRHGIRVTRGIAPIPGLHALLILSLIHI